MSLINTQNSICTNSYSTTDTYCPVVANKYPYNEKSGGKILGESIGWLYRKVQTAVSKVFGFEDNTDIFIQGLKSRDVTLRSMSSETIQQKLHTDKKFVTEIVKKDGWSLEYASKKMQNDEKIVRAALKQTGLSLKFASPRLQNNIHIVLRAIHENCESFQFASPELRNNKQIVDVMLKNWDLRPLKHAGRGILNNKEIMLRMIKKEPWMLEHASAELRDDVDIAVRAITKNIWALKYVSQELRNDKDFAHYALQLDHRAIEFINPKLLNDPDIARMKCKKLIYPF